MRAFLSAVLMAALLTPLGLRPASAQVGEVLVQLLARCHRDAAELCPGVEPGGGRIAACLYSRLNDLSPGCHRAMRDGIALRACGYEYSRFCRDVVIGDGRVARCLRDYRDEVNPRCSEALAFSRPRYSYDAPRYGAPRYDAPRYNDRVPDEYRDPKSPPYGGGYDEPRKYDDPAPEDDDRGPDDLK